MIVLFVLVIARGMLVWEPVIQFNDPGHCKQVKYELGRHYPSMITKCVEFRDA